MRLTDSLAEQALLETLLEESKPALPPGTERLHYLLATPFRYRSPWGSRFRSPFEPGVWYGAEEVRTSLAEKSYWLLRFLLDSPGTPELKAVPHTVFRASARTLRCLDLTLAPLVRDRAHWVHRTSYETTQALGTAARAASMEIIRYESVRDPQGAACIAVLMPGAFRRATPSGQHTWFVAASRTAVRCVKGEEQGATFEFTAERLL
jgi:hypothetical protein